MLTILRLSLVFIICAILSIQDVKCKKISVPILLSAFLLQIILIAIEAFDLLIPHLINSIVLTLFYFFQSRFARGKLGSGDILFAAFTGLSITFWGFLWLTLVIPPLAALLFALFFYIFNHKIAAIRIPYVPFMSIGLIATVIIELIF